MQKLIAKKAQSPKDTGAFAEEVKLEIKRITWPDRVTVMKSTGLILFIVIIATTAVSIIDAVFSEAIIFLRHL